MNQFENFKPIPTKIINNALYALGLLTILFLSMFINPEKANFLTCYFQELTGHPCPTCGLSHSFYAVSHLHLLDSFKFHLMGPIIFIIMLFLFLKSFLEIVIKKEIRIGFNPKITKITLIIFSCSWLSFWIIRFVNDL
jgi:hypothetical protein